MKICVLQPDYRGSQVDYRLYDAPRDLSPLRPGDQVDNLFLHKTTVHRQLREASRENYDIFVNLCEGYLEWDVPSIDVIWSLDTLRLPYTGACARLYDPSKELMKYVAHTRGVLYPRFVEAFDERAVEVAVNQLRFPLFVKPAHAGDSLGIDEDSFCLEPAQVWAKAGAVQKEYGAAMVEEFIAGREFTVLVAANSEDRFEPLAFQPIEFLFTKDPPFKTYRMKVQTHLPERNVPVTDRALANRLRQLASFIFIGFEGEGYARLDFRMDGAGAIWFLDINFACSVFYPPGYEGSADYILRYDPIGHAGFLEHVIAEGLVRGKLRKRRFARGAKGISGFGIHATEEIRRGDIVYHGEERSYRLATRSHILSTWPASQVEVFRQYGMSVGNGVFMLWDEDPREWAPQNHCCDPNTAYNGLDLIAVRDIGAGEELTVDYGSFSNSELAPFVCSCGATNCRRLVGGTSIDGR